MFKIIIFVMSVFGSIFSYGNGVVDDDSRGSEPLCGTVIDVSSTYKSILKSTEPIAEIPTDTLYSVVTMMGEGFLGEVGMGITKDQLGMALLALEKPQTFQLCFESEWNESLMVGAESSRTKVTIKKLWKIAR